MMNKPVITGITVSLLLLSSLLIWADPMEIRPYSRFHPFSGPLSAADMSPRPLPAAQSQKGPVLHSLDTLLFTGIPEVQREMNHYAAGAGKQYLTRVLLRGEEYLSFINSAVRELDLPWELAYLPVIESAFIPSAVSRSGAAGLWQFMMNSISPYDISVNQWMDERRDFWKATYAALAKLKTNYDILGDWLLAVGAYNCGLGAMQRAVAAAGTRNFWELSRNGYLPAETRAYVPRFLAVSHLASYPGRNGLPVSWTPVHWTRISVTGPVHLNRLAEAAGVPLKSLAAGNVELNQPVTPPLKEGYLLKVRQEYADSINDALGRTDLKLMDLELYTICSGDTLYALSRHYGISTDLLLEFNPGINPRSLHIGTKVVIPLIQPMPPYRGDSQTPQYIVYNQVISYTVQPGDTLTAISRKFDTTAADLAHNNTIELNAMLKPGMILKVPSAAAETPVQGEVIR